MIPLLLLRVAGHDFALRQRDIAEILPLPRLVALPEAPPVVAGAFSFAGSPVLVLPMSSLLGLSGPAEGTALYHHLILLPAVPGETRFAFRVDRVTNTIAAEPGLMPAGESFNGCVDGEIRHADALVPLLSVSGLLTGYERERLHAFAARDAVRAAIFRPAEPG